jgi:hypothetical protein
MALLVPIGFCIIGPQVLLVGTAPADLAHRGTSAAAAGFVNFMGYMGAATGDVATGHFASEHGGWQTAIYVWAGWAFAGAAIMAILWNTTSKKVGVLPGYVPKIGAMAALLAAAIATWFGEQPVFVQIATGTAIGCVVASYLDRRIAFSAIAAAMVALLGVFIGYVRGTNDVTWSESAAMVAYGLAIIAGLMILVEQNETTATCV